MKIKVMLNRILVILGIVSLLFLAGCGGGMSGNTSPPPVQNPTPTIATISPNSAVASGAAFTLTINGTNFVAASGVNFGGTAAATTFVNSTQLTAAIPAAAIATAGTAAVTVTNPAPGGGASNSVTFNLVTGLNPVSVVVAPDPTGKFGKFAYVPNSNSNNISMYAINSNTGALSFIGTIAAGTSPTFVTTDPSGKFAYVTNSASDNVSAYTIDPATGALTSAGTAAAGVKPSSVVVSPSGKFAYVTNSGSNNVSAYAIDAVTGALSSIGMVASGTDPQWVTMAPSGNFAYVADSASTDISVYALNSTTGALTPAGTVPAGVNPKSVAVHPSGSFAYVADCGGCANFRGPRGDLSVDAIDSATGALKFVEQVNELQSPAIVALHPSGKFAYVIDLGDGIDGVLGVLLYNIDVATGALTRVGRANGGVNPMSIAFDPSGKFAYVVDQASNVIRMYTINPTSGALTLIGTIGT